MKPLRVTVCCGPECGIRSADIEAALSEEVASQEAETSVTIDSWSCFGRCRSGPNMIVYGPVKDEPGANTGQGPSTMYNQLTPRKAACILLEHLLKLTNARALEAATK